MSVPLTAYPEQDQIGYTTQVGDASNRTRIERHLHPFGKEISWTPYHLRLPWESLLVH
jgi:hypothetical protein